MKTIRVDFNSVDADGFTRARSDGARRPVWVGDTVLAFDSNGSASIATVVRIGAEGTVHLILDPASWRQELVPA
jgi:hypothetical protein